MGNIVCYEVISKSKSQFKTRKSSSLYIGDNREIFKHIFKQTLPLRHFRHKWQNQTKLLSSSIIFIRSQKPSACAFWYFNRKKTSPLIRTSLTTAKLPSNSRVKRNSYENAVFYAILKTNLQIQSTVERTNIYIEILPVNSKYVKYMTNWNNVTRFHSIIRNYQLLQHIALSKSIWKRFRFNVHSTP